MRQKSWFRKSTCFHHWFIPHSSSLKTSILLLYHHIENNILLEKLYCDETVQVINFCFVFCLVLQVKVSLVPSRKSLLRPWSLSVLHHLALLLLPHVLLHHRGHLHHQVMWWHLSGGQEHFVSALWDELWSPRPKLLIVDLGFNAAYQFFTEMFCSYHLVAKLWCWNNIIFQHHLNIIFFA